MAQTLLALILGVSLALPAAAAQVKAEAKKPIRPGWSELKPEQQKILAPLKADWETLEVERRQKWIGIAKRYPKMTLAEQEQGRRLLKRAFAADTFMTTPRTTLNPLLELLEAASALFAERGFHGTTVREISERVSSVTFAIIGGRRIGGQPQDAGAVLEGAGLISRSRRATERLSHLEAEPLREATAWLAHYQAYWDERFEQLDAVPARQMPRHGVTPTS